MTTGPVHTVTDRDTGLLRRFMGTALFCNCFRGVTHPVPTSEFIGRGVVSNNIAIPMCSECGSYGGGEHGTWCPDKPVQFPQSYT